MNGFTDIRALYLRNPLTLPRLFHKSSIKAQKMVQYPTWRTYGHQAIGIPRIVMYGCPISVAEALLILIQYPSDDSDPDEPAYFTSSAPSSLSYSPSRRRRRHDSDGSYTPPAKTSTPAHHLVLKRSDSILEVISQEWTKEGGWGVWKASNTTFVYSLLLQSLEKWSSGLWSALLNVPDEVTTELSGSPYPWASLAVALAAAATAGIILAPIDLIRTK